MTTFEEFKIKYINSNKKQLEKLTPQQQIDKINDAYQNKLHDNERCKVHYAENKIYIQHQQKQYRDNNKEKLQQYKEDHKEEIQQRQKQYREANKEIIKEKKKQNYETNKEQIIQKLECECGCMISKIHLSRHLKTAKHVELLKQKEVIKQQHTTELIKPELPEQDKVNKNCDVCNIELIENYRNCECRRCEDWGGCKYINGYYYLMCQKCKKDFGTIKTDYWESSYRHGLY